MASLFFNNKEIHLWITNHFSHEEKYLAYREFLTEDEKQRERQFVTDSLRKRFVISRAILRMFLQYYLLEPNAAIELFYGKQGKPSLVDTATGLEFNLSHSQDIIIYGFARGFPIGVDIEYINPNLLKNNLENMVLSTSEIARFHQLDQNQKIMAFYRAWTRKEAVLKATGVGLLKSLQDIEVTFTSFEKPQVTSIDGGVAQAALWSIHNIEKIPGYCGAIAANAHIENMKIHYHYVDDKQLKSCTDFIDYLCKYGNPRG